MQCWPALALELVGGRGTLDGVGYRPQRLAGGWAELQRIVAKKHQNALWGCGKRDEADLDGVGHSEILQKSGQAARRKTAGRGIESCVVRQAHGLSHTMACQP